MTRTAASLTTGLALIAPLCARAHHFMDNALPGTWQQGLLSGLAHPVIGLDHAAFVIGAGFLLAMFAGGLWALVALVAGSLAGASFHLAGIALPGGEGAVALSVVLVAAGLFCRQRLPWSIAVALLALAGVWHGHAYAEAIFGAERAPLVAYLAGFSLTQLALAVGAFLAHRALMRLRLAAPACALLGGVIGAVGLLFLLTS